MKGVTEVPIEPQWVLSFPHAVPPNIIDKIARDVAAAIADGRPVVLADGGVLYDARNSGAPMRIGEIEATTDVTTGIELPRWVVVLCLVWTACFLSIAMSVSR